MKYIISLIFLLMIINPCYAITVANTASTGVQVLNFTDNANELLGSMIVIIPKEVLENTSTITAIRFLCDRDFITPPNKNFVFTFYKYYGLGTFSPIDSSYITPAQCIDFNYPITWSLYSPVTVDHNSDYAIGFYSASVTTGSWYLAYINTTDIFTYGLSNYTYQWQSNTLNHPNVTVVNHIGTSFLVVPGFTDIRNIPLYISGIPLESPSPTPTPTGTPMPTGTPLGNSTGNSDLQNLTQNPNGINNISIGNGTDTVGSVIDGIIFWSQPFVLFGIIIFIIRFFSIKEGV